MLLHDPFWTPRVACRAAHELGALVVAVHHASPALNAAGIPGPQELYRAALRRWYRRAYLEVDAVMSVVDTGPDARRTSTLRLRLGLDPAFGPWARDEVGHPGDHVLYAGRLSREKGVRELILDLLPEGLFQNDGVPGWPHPDSEIGPRSGNCRLEGPRPSADARIMST